MSILNGELHPLPTDTSSGNDSEGFRISLFATSSTVCCRLEMPVIEGLHQTQCPRPCSAHHQHMHDLMTGAVDIERPRIPTFRDPGRVDCCSREIQKTKANEVPYRLLLILQYPTVDKYPVDDRDKGRKAKERIHSYPHGAIHRASELLAHGKDCAA